MWGDVGFSGGGDEGVGCEEGWVQGRGEPDGVVAEGAEEESCRWVLEVETRVDGGAVYWLSGWER